MRHWRDALATALIIWLVQVSLAYSLTGATLPSPISIREQLDEFGAGAKVSVRLAGGQKLRGSIDAIEDQAFLLTTARESTPQRIAYDQVAALNLAKRVYRASGHPDPIEAKRVVLALGIGKHVAVKVPSGKKLHGHIQTIGGEHFILLPDNQRTPVQIAYSDVWYVEKNLSFGATVVLVVLILAAVVVIASVAATR